MSHLCVGKERDNLAVMALRVLDKADYQTHLLSEGEEAPAGSILLVSVKYLNGKVWLGMYTDQPVQLVESLGLSWGKRVSALIVLKWSPFDGFDRLVLKVAKQCQAW